MIELIKIIIVLIMMYTVFIYCPYNLLKLTLKGYKKGWLIKDNGILGNERIVYKIIVILLGILIGIYLFILEDYFFTKFWNKVLIFLG